MIVDYVSQDKVRLVYRHFAVLGERSLRAAVAAEAAGQQGQFWPYHDRLFEAKASGTDQPFTDERLRAIASGLNLNLAAFSGALDDPALAQRVVAETEQGRRLGVQRTPSVFVNTRKIEGALPYAVFQSAIDQDLPLAR